MNDKTQMLTMLREEFHRWEGLLTSISEEQITAPRLPSNLSIKDVVAHLRAWQQISVARLEAALHKRDPELPGWVSELGPDWEDDTDRTNAWIYQTNRDQPWSSVHRDWREGFLRFLELGQAIPEDDLVAPGRYAWLEGYQLSIVLQGSYEHHQVDHLEPLLAWLREHGNMKIEKT